MAELEDHHWWFSGTRRVILAELEAVLPDQPAGVIRRRVLDLGCGTGRTTALLARWGWVVGLDEAAWALASTSRRAPAAAPVRGSATRLPFADGCFDLVCALDLVEHVADDRAVLEEIGRVLRPAGLLLLTVPAWPWLWSEHDEALDHQRRYLAGTMRSLLAGAGLELCRLTHYNALLFPLAVAYRLLRRTSKRPSHGAGGAADRGSKAEVAPRSDLTAVPEPLNRLLGGVLAAERHLLRCIDLPLGLSLLAVARRRPA